MSKDYLPHKIDPFKSAVHETQVHGHLKIHDMQRLNSSLHSTEGEVEVNMVFAIDEQKICTIRGHVKTNVMLQCQRCMESFEYAIMSDFVAGVVKDEQEATDLPEGYTPVVASEDGMLVIQDMIEDELIVNLPVVPMHDPDKCKIKLPFEAGSSEQVETNNPFNVISILRSKEKKNS